MQTVSKLEQKILFDKSAQLSNPTVAYEKVKEVALRLERSLEAAEECLTTSSQHSDDRRAALQQKPFRTLGYSQHRLPMREEFSQGKGVKSKLRKKNMPNQAPTDGNRKEAREATMPQ